MGTLAIERTIDIETSFEVHGECGIISTFKEGK